MIVIMSPGDDVINSNASYLANKYDEKAMMFNMELDFSNETRITFLGHATQNDFGEQLLSPEAFVNDLIKNNIINDKPVTIDLIGCEMGFIENNKSYVTDVASRFYQEGYKNVIVKAVNNLVFNDDVSQMRIGTKKPDNEVYTVSYLPTADMPAYVKMVNEQTNDMNMRLIAKKHELLQIAERCENERNPDEIENIKFAGRQCLVECKELANSLNNITQEIDNKFFKVFATYPDLRFALDHNPNFIITYESYSRQLLSEAREKALILVNNRIGELEVEKQSAKESMLPEFFFGVDTKSYKIGKLHELRNVIMDASSDLMGVVRALLEDESFATRRTREVLFQIRELNTMDNKPKLNI